VKVKMVLLFFILSLLIATFGAFPRDAKDKGSRQLQSPQAATAETERDLQTLANNP
jgi:hypothetical protein